MTPLFLSTSGQLPKNPFVFVWNHSRFLNCRKPFWAAIIDPNWVYNRLKNDVVGLQGEITRFAGKWSHFSAVGRNRWFPIRLMWKETKNLFFLGILWHILQQVFGAVELISGSRLHHHILFESLTEKIQKSRNILIIKPS